MNGHHATGGVFQNESVVSLVNYVLFNNRFYADEDALHRWFPDQRVVGTLEFGPQREQLKFLKVTLADAGYLTHQRCQRLCHRTTEVRQQCYLVFVYGTFFFHTLEPTHASCRIIETLLRG